MKRQIKRRGLRTPPKGPRIKAQPMSSKGPQQALSDRISMVQYANSSLKSELARQRALTADLVYASSESTE